MPRRSGAIFSGLVKRFVWFSGIGLPVVFGRFGFGFLVFVWIGSDFLRFWIFWFFVWIGSGFRRFWILVFRLDWIVCRFDNTRLRRLFDA